MSLIDPETAPLQVEKQKDSEEFVYVQDKIEDYTSKSSKKDNSN